MSWTIDDSTIASNPGNLRLEPLQWIKHYPAWPLVLASCLLLSLGLVLLSSKRFLGLVPICLICTWLYWLRIKEHFKHGDARPGIIVSLDPMLIAISTDLSKGAGSFPVIKVIRKKLYSVAGKNPEIGLRLVTIALYKDHAVNPDSQNCWKDFDPRPAACATSNIRMIDRLMNSFDNDEWTKLQNSLDQLPKPYAPGLYHVKISEKTDLLH